MFENEIADVLGYAELREDRAPEVLTQIDSQLGFWGAVVQMRPDLTPRTFELLEVALQLAIFVEMRFKHELACWRPVNFSCDVQPLVTTPGHGSLPMGHATQAYMAAYLLGKLADAKDQTGIQAMLYRQAFRISFNRIVAGVHFPVDLPAGAVLGMALGEYFWHRADEAATTPKDLAVWQFDAANYAAHPITQGGFVSGYETGRTAALAFAPAPVTRFLWRCARQEWRTRQPA